MPEIFGESSRETVLRCEKSNDGIVRGFLRALGAAAGKGFEKKNNNGGQIYYILFSYLHSSIFLQKYLIRIDLMSRGFYKEEPLATSYWNAGEIYRNFEEDIGKIRRKVAEKVSRIREYEEDYIRYAYAPYYHQMAGAFIREVAEGFLENSGEMQKNMKDGEQTKLLFGEYMGKADFFMSIGRDRIYEILQDLCR